MSKATPLLTTFLLDAVLFGRSLIGIVTRPYETYRRIVDHGHLGELVYIGALLALYFAVASLVKTAAFRPFLLTREFLKLTVAAGITYILVVTILWVTARLVGGNGRFRGLMLAWAYTLIPTLTWFLVTSVLWVVLPPPRTTSIYGIVFSLAYLMFTATLFFWKTTLAYLALRFSLHLDLVKIASVAGMSLPIIGIYSVAMYRWGIFKIPFI